MNDRQNKHSKHTVPNTLVSTNIQKKQLKSTIKLSFVMKVIRSTFSILELISPSLAGWWATRLWISTRRYPEPAREKQWLKDADISELDHEFGPIKLYHWRKHLEPAPTVLLIHGWNGRGLQLAGFVKPLLEEGFNVISFDAPGHGRTPGTQSNLLRVANVVQAISRSIGPIDSVISHSFGAMVMAKLANDGLNIRKAVAISAPKNADFLINAFCAFLNIKPRSKKNLLKRIKTLFGDDIFPRISTLNNVKNLSIPGLIIHDKHDSAIPVTHARELNRAWLGSELLITQNLGHQRILRNQIVINAVLDFIAKNKATVT